MNISFAPQQANLLAMLQRLLDAKLKREHSAFAQVWDANLKTQGFVEAFVRQQKGDT
jgi:hypothetical protein